MLLYLPFLTFSQGVLQENWQTKKAKAETLLLQLPVGELSGSFSSTMCSAVPDRAESLAKMGIEIYQDLVSTDANEILSSGNCRKCIILETGSVMLCVILPVETGYFLLN